MHVSYARLPCGVTLTGSVRAHVPHALFIPGAQSLRDLPCAGCRAGFSFRSRLMAERLQHKSDKIWFPG